MSSRDEQEQDEEHVQEAVSPFKKALDSKWVVWTIVAAAIVLACATATITFAIRQRMGAKPATYTQMDQLEQQYGMANMQVTSSNGLGVDAGTTPVADTTAPTSGVPDASSTLGAQTTAPKIGPAPSAEEAAASLQPVTGVSGGQLNLQAGGDVQNGSASANVNASALNGTVNINVGL